MAKINEEYLIEKAKQGDYAPYISFVISRKCMEKVQFSYIELIEELDNVLHKKNFKFYNTVLECLELKIENNKLTECAGRYYPQ